ncbi:MAG: hypothetical protein EOO23_09090 [Comamonadaceae bacterium]|nr:MAG: hypothetical protein EOO23_09090 [Comamonadaceae bacterium]
MSTSHLEPARSVIRKIGVDTVVSVTGKHISRVYRWMYPKERGGTGGLIPHADALALLEYAKANEVDLSPGDFFAAAPVEGRAA